MKTAVWAIALIPCVGCAAQVVQSADHGQWTAAIGRGQKAMQGIVATGAVPGAAVAVAVGRQIVWTEGFGYADLEQRVPATAETRFGIGSISKTFTMAAMMTLVDDGILELDAPIETYLPDFPHRGKAITIRRISVHQSGMSDQFATEHYQTSEHFPTIDSAYQHIKQGRIEYPPGTRTAYATGLYTIIARAMEAVTGQPYLAIMEERIFGPVGLTSVVANDPAQLVPNRTRFYINADAGGFQHGPYYDPSFKLPGAGFVATAQDVARFGAALLGPGILREKTRQEMFKPVPLLSGEPTEFALGIRYADLTGRSMLHQPGGGIGISTWLFVFPEQDLVIALLSNVATGPMGGSVADEISDAFLNAIQKHAAGN